MKRTLSTRRDVWPICAIVLLGVLTASMAWGEEGRATATLENDSIYYESSEPFQPGRIVGAPVAVESLPPGDPHALRPSRVNVLVHMNPRLNRGAVQRAEVRGFAGQKGAVVKHEYNTVLPNVLNLRDFPESALNSLESMPGVVKVERDEYHPNLLLLHDSTPLINALQSQLSGAGLSVDGTGVRVCVCDTGIDSDHIMYSDRIDATAGRDFYNGDNDPEDDHGHGSHVSGIAVGGTGLSSDLCGTGSVPFQGVAPEATLIGAKILNSGGGGYDSDIIAGIDYCADQSPSGGRADVINLSIGTGMFSAPCSHDWAIAANNAVANGVVVVAASGNNNYSNAMSSPACGADVIAVGATWKEDYPTCEDGLTNWNWGDCTDFGPQTDEVGCFSNESDHLDVTAPGLNIWSASNASGGSSITGMSGTSMASPHVAGLAALLLDADPSLTPPEVRQLIRDGAIDLGTPGFDRGYGYGRIDAISSLSLLASGCEVSADCDDGLYCNGSETCVDTICQPGTQVDCTDDGLFCNGNEVCDEELDACAHTGDPCTSTLICHEDNDICVECFGHEDCNDGEPCTADFCDIGTGQCSNTWASCGVADGCCAPDCSGLGDPDCPCGNGVCQEGEDCDACPMDCISGQGGTCDVCFKGVCNGECHPKKEGPACGDCAPIYCCGDGFCEGDEDGNNCEIDCGSPPFCGDGNCDPDEDQCDCPADCGPPSSSETNCDDGIDEDCDGSTDCNDSNCDADPACNSCGAKKSPCEEHSDCCSNRCSNKGVCL